MWCWRRAGLGLQRPLRERLLLLSLSPGWGSRAAAAASSLPSAGPGGWYEALAASPPVHWAESGLVALQAGTGLPWWLSIVGAGAALRTGLTLPLAAHQGYILAKLENLQPEIESLAKRLRYEVSIRGKQLGWSEKVARKEEGLKAFPPAPSTSGVP